MAKNVSNSQWEIIKNFKGKSHENGGIDISIDNGVISMSNTNGKFKAKEGVVIPKNPNQKDYPINDAEIYPTPTALERFGRASSDFGARLLNGIKTFGGSYIGDAIKAIDPKLAKGVSKATFGMIEPTPQSVLDAASSDNPNAWNNRIGQVNNAATMYLGGELAGAAVGEAIPLIGNQLGKLKKGTDKAIRVVPEEKIVSKFESEIDWGKFNKEIPKNKELLKEYHEIERTAKANGTWMKNKDGSEFVGDPEVFIKIRSKNFKKAFPDGYEETFRGINKKTLESDPTLLEKHKKDPYILGNGIFSSNKELAKGYGDNLLKLAHKKSEKSFVSHHVKDDWSNLNFNYSKKNIDALKKSIKHNEKAIDKFPEQADNLKQTIKQQKDKLKWIENLSARDKRIIDGINKHDYWDGKLKYNGSIDTDDVARFMEANNLDFVEMKNIVDGSVGDVKIVNHTKGNFLKNILHNNGMFDMKDPNIYKGLIGTGTTLGIAKNKSKNKK